MEAKNDVNSTVGALLKGMDNFITTKTVVGEPTQVGDTIILPLIDASFGVAAGAFCNDQKNNGAGGMSGKITPSAVLVIQNGEAKLVNVKNQDSVTKILDMVPGFVDKFSSKLGGKSDETPSEDKKKDKQPKKPEEDFNFDDFSDDYAEGE
ncbi:MAG: GerW family sporulation protein [Lachnospiraceae bacterium]|nr:GerW family sporulation protein [Lachnospiraceae bacterium]